MGIYVNPDNCVFRQVVNSEIYVDKTGIIAILNKVLGTEQKIKEMKCDKLGLMPSR